MTSNVTPPLNANDPEVERAMKAIEQLPPTQRTEFIRTTYRYVYAYRRTRDPQLLTEFMNSIIGSVVLFESPEYARAVEELRADRQATTGQPAVDVREFLAAERARRAG